MVACTRRSVEYPQEHDRWYLSSKVRPYVPVVVDTLVGASG
jgi:hypothetical protein